MPWRLIRHVFSRLRAVHTDVSSKQLHENESAILRQADPAADIVRVWNATKGTLVAERVVWATGAAKRHGLLGYDRLDADEGMFLVPCQWIHMFGMRFPIDVAFLARDGRVLAVHHGLCPNRLSRLVLRAEGVLELAAGALRSSRTLPGDKIEFQDRQNGSHPVESTQGCPGQHKERDCELTLRDEPSTGAAPAISPQTAIAGCSDAVGTQGRLLESTADRHESCDDLSMHRGPVPPSQGAKWGCGTSPVIEWQFAPFDGPAVNAVTATMQWSERD